MTIIKNASRIQNFLYAYKKVTYKVTSIKMDDVFPDYIFIVYDKIGNIIEDKNLLKNIEYDINKKITSKGVYKGVYNGNSIKI